MEDRGHYVQFIYDFGEHEVSRVGYQPDLSVVPANAFQMMIVCDYNARVVVRSLVDNQLTVVGTTVSRGEKLQRREQLAKGGPSEMQWLAIEKAIGEEIRTRKATQVALDPGAIDEAKVVHPPDAKESTSSKIFTWVGVGVLVAALGVGFYLWANRGSTERANGDACTKDEQCASGWCHVMHCKLPKHIGNGERCSTARECVSGRCNARNICH